MTEQHKIHSHLGYKKNVMENDKSIFVSKADSTFAFDLESIFTAASVD